MSLNPNPLLLGVTDADSPLRVGMTPTGASLELFADSARDDGKRLVVGALITDGQGRIYVQKRSADRELFPGGWDIVGGHVEAGETAVEALKREIREETGWELDRIGPTVEVLDWTGSDGVERREADLLTLVKGDLAEPRLEPDKHTESRWLTSDELALLGEGRSPGDLWVRDVVARAFELLQILGS